MNVNPRRRRRPILRAILAIVLSMVCFSVLNAMSKTLSTSAIR